MIFGYIEDGNMKRRKEEGRKGGRKEGKKGGIKGKK